MLIIVDSREQKPLWTGTQCAKMALVVGDYTTADLLGVYHIERKSLQDLYGTITKGHLRFQKEIYRAKAAGITLEVVVEGTLKDFEAKNFPRGEERKLDGKVLVKIITTISKRYELPIIWCKNRVQAKRTILKKLQQHGKNPKPQIKTFLRRVGPKT